MGLSGDVASLQGWQMGLRKLQNYCMLTATEFTDICLTF